MERPNTVAGLVAKRSELIARLTVSEADAKALRADIDALDTVIKLFAPDIKGLGYRTKRLPPPYKSSKGEMRRLLLDMIRERDGAPVTSLIVADRFCEVRGLGDDDRAIKTVRDRVASSITRMRALGVIREVKGDGQYKWWTVA